MGGGRLIEREAYSRRRSIGIIVIFRVVNWFVLFELCCIFVTLNSNAY